MATDPLIGAVVDRRYRIVDRLGTGGMGSVYLAEHSTLARKFAIKVLRHEFNEQPEFLARFLRESRAATTIDHPNVIEVIDTGTLPDDRAYYVMEHLQGEDLQKTLRRGGPLVWPRVRHIALQICDALAVAHAQGIVHRDLKPANCFRIRRGADEDFIKLLDFGIVKLLGEQNLTGDGALLGTTHYMAPEQAMGRPVDHRADIYALGVMLYQLLSARHPFPGRNGVEMLYAILHDAPVPLRDAVGETPLPDGLEAVIADAMHRDPNYRTASMAALAAALRAIEADPPTIRRTLASAITEPAEPPPEPPTADASPTAALAGPSHKPTRVGRAAPEPSFDSKLTAERVTTDPGPPSVSTAVSDLFNRPPDLLPPPNEASAPALASDSGERAPVTSVSNLSARTGRQSWWRWLAAASLVIAVGAYAVATSRTEPNAPTSTSPLELASAETTRPAPVPLALADTPAVPVPAEPAIPPQPASAAPAAPAPDIVVDEPIAQPVARARPPSAATDSARGRIDAIVNTVKQKIQKRCFSRLTVEVVAVDVWIEARTGALLRSQVAPPHDRTSTRVCVEQVFKNTAFPPFPGRDYKKLVTTQIRPKA